MKHLKQLALSLLILLLAWSCAERGVCPAYQSAFIHDKDALTKRFSYFKEDSTPKLLSASKDMFGIAEKEPYWKKARSLNTVKLETIYPQLDDSTQLAGDIVLQAEMDVVDSVALDSAAVNEIGWTEHFNVEQEFYFHYFNDILVYPEERALLLAENEQLGKSKKGQASQSGEKQNFFQKFLSLFKKKQQSDEVATDDLTDTENDEEAVDSPPNKKKFSFGKKKEKNPPQDKEPTEEEVEKDEDDEDEDF